MTRPGTSLQQALATRLRLLETTLQPNTLSGYKRTARRFLEFLRQRFPAVGRPCQLQRDPHLLGWLEELFGYRTSKGQPLNNASRSHQVLQLRTLLELMEDLPQPPPPGLLQPADVPKRQFPLPRPLSADEDARLRRYWDTATGALDSALYLMRLTGMRIGECVDLEPDSLRHLGDNRWSLHVPHGKPRSERWVPVEDRARQLLERLAFLRTLPPVADPRFLLARPSGRAALMRSLRQQLCHAAAEAGLKGHIVPHQLRHTYATTLLRAGISLPSLMRLLGHHNANMTLIYVDVTQQDLHREYHAALARPRYLAPPPRRQVEADDRACAAPGSIREALHPAIDLLDAHCRHLSGEAERKPFVLLRRRLLRIASILGKLLPAAEAEN